MIYRILVGHLMLFSVALLGCGGGGALKTIPVTGTVTVDGKPLTASAGLTFTPKAPEGENVYGKVVNGKFDGLSTYGDNDGIPEGEYDVMLMTDPSMPSNLPGVKPFNVTIAPTTTTIAIDFKGTGKTERPLAIPGKATPGGS